MTRRIRKRIWFLYAVYVVALATITLVWMRPLLLGPAANARDGTDTVWQHYYPELWSSGLLTAETRPSADRFDVLLLGGSVLEQLTPYLADAFARGTGGRARVFGLARAAHTTRDSRNKLRRVGAIPVDLVIVYHGINDVRMNCCPPGAFRDDYGHCAWYASFERRLRRGRLTLAEALSHRIQGIALGEPEPELLDEGSNLKTPAAIRKSVAWIVETTRRRMPSAQVLLATFATCIPDDYTRTAFEQRRLGYGSGSYRPCPVELWGRPEAVRAGVAAHNDVIRSLAAERSTLFCDLASELDGRLELFVDPCHFSEAGCRLAARRLAQAAAPAVRDWLARRPVTSRTNAATDADPRGAH